jgi:hypothetical protein
MSPESPQSNQNLAPQEIKKNPEILAAVSSPNEDMIEVPAFSPDSPGPEAPQLIFKEKPILGVAQEPRIDLEAPKTPDQIKDERFMGIIKELEDQWMKETHGYLERQLSIRELEQRKHFAELAGQTWDGKTTAPTDEWMDFYFSFRGGQSVPAKAKKILAERFPEYAEKPKAKIEEPKEPEEAKESKLAEDKGESVDRKKFLVDQGYGEDYVKELSNEQVEGLYNKFAVKPVKPEEKAAEAQKAEVDTKESEAKVPSNEVSEKDAKSREVVADVHESEAEPENEKTLVETFRQKFGIDNIIDSTKIVYNGFIAGWYEGKVAEKGVAITELNKSIVSMEKDEKHISEQLKIFRSDGNISEKTLLKIESERQKMETKIGGAKQGLNQENAKLESLAINRSVFERNRDLSCRTYTERTRAELRPFEEKLSDLALTRDQLRNEISRDNEMLSKRRAELAKLAEKAEAEKFPSLRRATREIIKKIETEASAFEKEIRDREKHGINIDKEIDKAQKRAEPLRDKCSELERIMAGKEPEEAPVLNVKASERKIGRDVIIDSSGNSSEGSSEETVKIVPEAESVYSVEELVDSWNEVNGSKMLINPETFKKNVFESPKRKEGSRISVNEFWSSASLYSARFGNQERLEGMPDMKKEAKKKGGFWRWLFGLDDSRMGKKRLLENTKNRRNKPPQIKK